MAIGQSWSGKSILSGYLWMFLEYFQNWIKKIAKNTRYTTSSMQNIASRKWVSNVSNWLCRIICGIIIKKKITNKGVMRCLKTCFIISSREASSQNISSSAPFMKAASLRK